MKSTVSFLLMFFILINVFATNQISDKLIYQGRLHEITINPLDKYFKKFPDKKPHQYLQSTALWRGYLATFEIKNQQLLVKDIEVQMQILGKDRKTGSDTIGSILFDKQRLYIKNRKDKSDSIPSDLFRPGRSIRKDGTLNPDTTVWCSVVDSVFPKHEMVKCDWYTGFLILSNWKRLKGEEISYYPIYEEYIVIEINKGMVVTERKLNSKEYLAFIDSQLKAYKKTEDYKKRLEQIDKYFRLSESATEKY